MREASELSGILAEMGHTADEVAATLRAAGIKGVRNTVRFLNPIVKYSQQHILVDNYALDVMQPGILRMKLQTATHDLPLPKAVIDFLAAFDTGAYPDLELSE
jgi:hypothetical protein